MDEKETRTWAMDVEIREEDGQPRVVGYAAVFNRLSDDLGGMREKIDRHAFDDAIAAGVDVRALWQHDTSYVLGRTTNGTLRLSTDINGLKVDITPPPTQWAQDAVTSMRRGDVNQMSFGFYVPQGGDSWETDAAGQMVRTLRKVELLEVSPVTFAAYPQTSVSVRAKLDELRAQQVASEDIQSEELARARGEALRTRIRIREVELS